MQEPQVGMYIQPNNPDQPNPNYKGWVGLDWISISGRAGFIFLNLNWIGSVSGLWDKTPERPDPN